MQKILKYLQLTEDELKDPKVILDKLEEYFIPVRNVSYERYLFHNSVQQPHETIDKFVIKLKQLAETCTFGSLEDEMIRDMLVLGCQDNQALTKLFREKECDLKNALETL